MITNVCAQVPDAGATFAIVFDVTKPQSLEACAEWANKAKSLLGESEKLQGSTCPLVPPALPRMGCVVVLCFAGCLTARLTPRQEC